MLGQAFCCCAGSLQCGPWLEEQWPRAEGKVLGRTKSIDDHAAAKWRKENSASIVKISAEDVQGPRLCDSR